MQLSRSCDGLKANKRREEKIGELWVRKRPGPFQPQNNLWWGQPAHLVHGFFTFLKERQSHRVKSSPVLRTTTITGLIICSIYPWSWIRELNQFPSFPQTFQTKFDIKVVDIQTWKWYMNQNQWPKQWNWNDVTQSWTHINYTHWCLIEMN